MGTKKEGEATRQKLVATLTGPEDAYDIYRDSRTKRWKARTKRKSKRTKKED